jgi:hypothetical protein
MNSQNAHLEKYERYLRKTADEVFDEPFWLTVAFNFDAPSDLGTRKQFFSKTHDHDLLVVGCVTKFIDPFAVDTAARLVPELDVEFKDAQGNLFIRDTAPLYAVASHLYSPELWHESFVIPRNSSLEVNLTVTRSATASPSKPQSITGELTFKCVRFQRTR